MEGHEPTLTTHALQRELEDLARHGVMVELREPEQAETSKNKNPGGTAPPAYHATTLEDTHMSMNTPNAPPPVYPAPTTEPVTDTNWGAHIAHRLEQIGREVAVQNKQQAARESATGTAKQVLVVGAGVALGTAAVVVVDAAIRWIFGSKTVAPTLPTP